MCSFLSKYYIINNIEKRGITKKGEKINNKKVRAEPNINNIFSISLIVSVIPDVIVVIACVYNKHQLNFI